MSASPPKSGHLRTKVATVIFSSDDHCPIGSAAILRMCNTDPLRAVQRDKGGPEEAVTVASPVEGALGNSTTTKSVTVPITATVKADLDAPIALDQEEIQRRRDLVRALFNDFWSDAHDKPAAFVERLDQAQAT